MKRGLATENPFSFGADHERCSARLLRDSALRPILCSLAVALLLCGSAFGAGTEYPLKVTVLEVRANTSGHADVDDSGSIHGIDFEYACDFKLERLPDGQFYSAKWTKPRAELRLLVPKPGEPGKFGQCDLRTTLHDEVYVHKIDKLTLVPQQELRQWKAEEEFAKREITDLSEYSVKLLVVNEYVTATPTRFLGLPAGRFAGWGQGDVFESWSAHGVDFGFECIAEMPAGLRYVARWIDPQNELEVLVPVPGQQNKYYPCKLTTSMKQVVYVKLRLGGPGSFQR